MSKNKRRNKCRECKKKRDVKTKRNRMKGK